MINVVMKSVISKVIFAGIESAVIYVTSATLIDKINNNKKNNNSKTPAIIAINNSIPYSRIPLLNNHARHFTNINVDAYGNIIDVYTNNINDGHVVVNQVDYIPGYGYEYTKINEYYN